MIKIKPTRLNEVLCVFLHSQKWIKKKLLKRCLMDNALSCQLSTKHRSDQGAQLFFIPD